MDQTTQTEQPFVYLHYFGLPVDADAEMVAIAFEKCNFVAYRTILAGEMRPVRDA